MAPVNDSVPQLNGAPEKSSEESGTNEPHKFTFPSHQFHMVNLARMCQENKEYTDCVIKVGEEELRAHKLVLGSVSPFLKLVFADIPSTSTESTIIVPGVKQRVVKALLDFFYTGQMTVERQDTSDLQLLIDTLKIDPGLITVDALPKPNDQINQAEKSEQQPSSSEPKEKLEENKVDKKLDSSSANDQNDQKASTSDNKLKRKAESEDDDESESAAKKKPVNSHP